jgi:para-aminobenzoate synthetase/4-amino-4-deoxychorismate lyase
MTRRRTQRSSNLIDRILNREGLFTLPFLDRMEREGDLVLLESARADDANLMSYVFTQPVDRIVALSLDAVERRLADLEEAHRGGYWLAGYLPYEAGYAFEKSLPRPADVRAPLLWFGVYERPLVFNRRRRAFISGKTRARAIARMLDDAPPPGPTMRFRPQPTVSAEEYAETVERIQRYIVEGDTYQVNFTMKQRFPWSATAAGLYAQLRERQRVAYSAFIAHRTHRILSFSPELFFRLDGSRLTLKPMKGTAPRGRTLDEDRHVRASLAASEKDRAENLMIVDLLRNDAGKIARTGSVRVARFFDIERLETLHQATSTIEATVRRNVGFDAIFKALFPSGSVTGAPKIRTMEIIHELEREPRGVYTGAVGFIAPERKAVFSVAIRTVEIERKTKRAELGIGSGIVSDSRADAEYRECLLKGAFVSEQRPGFELLETFRWHPRQGWFLLRWHLRRLALSASYFDFVFRKEAVQRFLQQYGKRLFRLSEGRRAFRVRVTMNRSGELNAVHSPLEELVGPQVVKLSQRPTDSNDRFLYHKTTYRPLYDRELERAMLAGYFDVLFVNERREVTEGARSNVVIRKGRSYVTPPWHSGLLPGTFRHYLLTSQKLRVREGVMTLDDVATADEVLMCNAVRGLVPVVVEGLSPTAETVKDERVEENDAAILVAENGAL